MGWLCLKCATENSAGLAQCKLCQARAPGGMTQMYGWSEWDCLVCTKHNPQGRRDAVCINCGELQGTTVAQVALREKRKREEEEQAHARAQQREKLLQAKLNYVAQLGKQLLQEDPEARRARLALHKLQYQARDLSLARKTYIMNKQAAEAELAQRRYEEELERIEAEAREREHRWLRDLGVVPASVQALLDDEELTLSSIKEMSNTELVNLGFSTSMAESILKAVVKEARAAAIAAGEYYEEEEEEEKVPAGPTPEEIEEAERQAEEQRKKAIEDAEAAEAARQRAEVEEAVRLREEKQKLREAKQAEKREANKKRQAKLAAEKKKKEELRLAKLKEKAEAAKLEARRKEEEAYEAERVANRAKMEAFLAAERNKEDLPPSEPEPEPEAPAVHEEEPALPAPIFLSSGRLLTQLSQNAFSDTGGELRLGLLALSTSCATVYGKRATISRRELTWLLKAIIKVYGENIIVTTPLADEMEIAGAEIVLNLGLQLRALLPVAKPSDPANSFNDSKLRSFDVSAAVAAAIGPDIHEINPEYHASIVQRRSRLTDLLSRDGVSVYHIPSLEWETHGYHCIRGILTESSDMMLAIVDAIPTPSPPGLLWDSVRMSLMKKIPMVVIKSHESGADVHGFRSTDTLGRTLLARYSMMPCL